MSSSRQVLLGEHRSGVGWSRIVAVGAVAFIITALACAPDVGNADLGSVLVSPLALVWLVPATWAGYRRGGLVVAWLFAYVSLLGGYVSEYMFDLSSLSITELAFALGHPGIHAVLLVAAVGAGTLPCLFGYLLRWYRSLEAKPAVIDRSWTGRESVRALKYVFAASVFAIAGAVGRPAYPVWPTLGGFPVDPELVVPGLLGVVALADVSGREISAGSVATGVLAVLTMVVAVTSLSTLYAGSGGGVFFGGVITLLLGIALAVTTVAVDVIRFGLRQGMFEADRRRAVP